MTQNRRCRRPLRTPLTSSHQNLILKIELCQNRRRHRSSRPHRVDVTSSHQNPILKIELCQNRRRHRSSRLHRVDVTSSNEMPESASLSKADSGTVLFDVTSSHQNPIRKIKVCQNRPFPTTVDCPVTLSTKKGVHVTWVICHQPPMEIMEIFRIADALSVFFSSQINISRVSHVGNSNDYPRINNNMSFVKSHKNYYQFR